jgi:hypothetical protein
MAAATVSQALINDTDAHFRAWGKSISDQLLAGSWALTADTGNDANGNGLIDFTTVVKPAAISTVQGYQIWKSNDAAGSLVNIFLKIEYGSFSTSANQPQIWLTIGFASDGSGNLTGTISTRTAIHVNTTATTTAVNCNLAAGAGWACMMLGTAASLNFYFSIERTHDASLNFQNEVLIILMGTAAGSGTNQVVTQSVAYVQSTWSTAGNGALQGILPPAGNSVVSAVAGLGLVFGYRGGFTNPSMNLKVCHTGDLGAAQGTFTVTDYGATHTYIINTGNSANILVFPAIQGTGYDTISRFE